MILFIAKTTASPDAATTLHGGDLFVHIMLLHYIYTLFAEALEKFEPISSQPTHSHLAELREVLAQILLVIPYNEENVIHNFVGLIQDPKTYTADYTTAFLYPRKHAIYDVPVRDGEKAQMHARKEAIHKARICDFTTYEAVECKMGKFILSVIEDTWVHKLRRDKNYYTLVTAGQLLDHLQ